MQIAVWVSAILFTQRLYRTMTRSTRQADCCLRATEPAAVILKFALQNRRRTNSALHLRSIDAAK